MARINLSLLYLLACLLFLPFLNAQAQTQPSPLVVVYADGNVLNTWRERDFAPRKIADLVAGTASVSVSPLISLSATKVIFRREDALWIANLTGNDPAPH